MSGFRQLHGHLEMGPPMAGRYDKLQRVIKEVADRCLAFALLLLLSPLMLAIAIPSTTGWVDPFFSLSPVPVKAGLSLPSTNFGPWFPMSGNPPLISQTTLVVPRLIHNGSHRLDSFFVRPVWMNSPSSGTYSRET